MSGQDVLTRAFRQTRPRAAAAAAKAKSDVAPVSPPARKSKARPRTPRAAAAEARKAATPVKAKRTLFDGESERSDANEDEEEEEDKEDEAANIKAKAKAKAKAKDAAPKAKAKAKTKAKKQTTIDDYAAAGSKPAQLEGAQLDAATLAALENLLEIEDGGAALGKFHAAVRRAVPVTAKTGAATLEALVRAGVASEGLVARVRAQLVLSSRDPTCTDVRRVCGRSRCGDAKCGRPCGVFRTVCAHCGSASVAPAGRELTDKQRESLRKRRENAAVRAIKYADALRRKEPEQFEYYAGDVAFLVRNAIPRSVGRVSQAADKLVRGFAKAYDKSESGVLDEYAEHDHLMGWVEMQHAKLEIGLLDAPGELDDARRRAARVLSRLSLEDVTRLVPAELGEREVPLSAAGYCRACGRFEELKRGACPGHAEEGRPECGERLERVTDWETVCEAIVWSSVFHELGVPVRAADGKCSVGDVLRLLRLLRPYGNRREMGRDSYQLMCYFITHLIFVLTGWGAARMDCRRALAEEYLFLLTNMSSVVELGDAELVGEFVHSLRLFGADDWCPAMLEGTRFLLKTEKRGLFVSADDEYRKRYHAAYCGLIGLAEWTFDRDREFGWHLFKGMPARWRRHVDPDLAVTGAEESESESEGEGESDSESDSE